jgi:flagellar basal-body rod modification protein FlgD
MLTSNASPTPAAATTPSSAASAASSAAGPNLAGNFNEFLQLLTTQLQHQDPTSPLDPNQFTQELVQFSSVEQQINTNTSLTTLISLQQTQQAASAMQFIGANVAVSGTTAQLANGQANWNYSVTQPATATISITNASGQPVFSTSQTVQPGTQTFTWNGTDSQGNTHPSGPYTISITATGANGQTVPVTTQIQGVVTGVDVSTSPPNLSIGGQSYPLNQITQVLSAGTGTPAH